MFSLHSNMLKLSIIIVVYKSLSYLQICLKSLLAQEELNLKDNEFEIIVVNNCPEDSTNAWLVENYPRIKVISNPANTGYAGGNNLGVHQARGKWLFILNPDVVLHPKALVILLKTAEENPNALLNPKLLNPDGSVNACGNIFHYTGIVTCRGLNESTEHYQNTHNIPLISGAAFFVRHETMQALGGFDEDYFMYLEDADLSLRAKLQGYNLVCAAGAEITHNYTLAMSAQKFYCLERNRLLTLFKLLETKTLWLMLPALLLTEFATWAFAFSKGWSYLRAKWQGYLWLRKQKQVWLTKRKVLQEQRFISDNLLLRESITPLPFRQLMTKGQLSSVLSVLTNPLYFWFRPYKRSTTGETL